MLPTHRRSWLQRFDWLLFGAALLVVVFGLVTMYSFSGDQDYFAKQLISLGVAAFGCIVLTRVDTSIFHSTRVIILVYGLSLLMLVLIFFFGATVKGSQSWFRFGGFSFQPSDIAKLALILTLAKYFTRRHIEIRRIRHIFISGMYAAIPCLLILAQPDFGSAVILAAIWFGMLLVSGISYKHVLAVVGVAAIAVGCMWIFVFQDYQKARILTFIHPLADIRGAGYNAYQSMIAVGSGQWIGKGVGYGTQSRLQYLPEHQTDFIFASFAEEWGFVGVLLILVLYGIIFWRIVLASLRGGSTFETLLCLGVAVYIAAHVVINIGMNIGLLPVTGVPLPFMSYGGSHMLAEFAALGLVIATGNRAKLVSARTTRDQPELHFQRL